MTEEVSGVGAGGRMGAGRVQRVTVDARLLDAASRDASLVFVDFDHTLLACNSTELFIATCKPSLVVAIIDFVVRRCVPWRLSRLPNWFRLRDYVCCLAIVALCPGSIARWRRVAPALFERHISREMADALRPIAPAKMVIITFGMAFIVRAMLRDSAWSSVTLIATPIFAGPSYFKGGKRPLAMRHAGEAGVAAASLVTDSLDDYDLLSVVKAGFLIAPQGAPFTAAERLYLPLRYTAAAKYTRSYVADQLILVELLLLLISTSNSSAQFLQNCVFIPILFLSIICIYEIGYFENDMKAARLERNPTLKDDVVRFRFYPIFPGAWIWAVLLGALGNLLACAVLHVPYAQLPLRLSAWISGLALLQTIFQVYNRPNLRVRLHLYPALQLFKFLPVMILATASPIGAMVIMCQIATMWAIYLTYRHGGQTKDIQRELLRVVLMTIGVVVLLTTNTWTGVAWQFQLVALAMWGTARVAKAPALSLVRRRHTADLS